MPTKETDPTTTTAAPDPSARVWNQWDDEAAARIREQALPASDPANARDDLPSSAEPVKSGSQKAE